MTDDPLNPPKNPRGSTKDFLIFLAKLFAYLAGLLAFGLLIFWLRRLLHR